MVTPPLFKQGHDTPELDGDLPATWQRMGIGVGVYVRLDKPFPTEPCYLAGLGRPATVEDIDAAIKFLGVIRDGLFVESVKAVASKHA